MLAWKTCVDTVQVSYTCCLTTLSAFVELQLELAFTEAKLVNISIKTVDKNTEVISKFTKQMNRLYFLSVLSL